LEIEDMAKKTLSRGSTLVLNLPALEDTRHVLQDLIKEATNDPLSAEEFDTATRMTEGVLSICLEASENAKLDLVMATVLDSFVVEVVG
jgi:hypothetical protein